MIVIDAYLSAVRDRLAGLPDEEIQEIVAELRSHLVERAARRGEAAAVSAMGSPAEIADLYLADSGAEGNALACASWPDAVAGALHISSGSGTISFR